MSVVVLLVSLLWTSLLDVEMGNSFVVCVLRLRLGWCDDRLCLYVVPVRITLFLTLCEELSPHVSVNVAVTVGVFYRP